MMDTSEGATVHNGASAPTMPLPLASMTAMSTRVPNALVVRKSHAVVRPATSGLRTPAVQSRRPATDSHAPSLASSGTMPKSRQRQGLQLYNMIIKMPAMLGRMAAGTPPNVNLRRALAGVGAGALLSFRVFPSLLPRRAPTGGSKPPSGAGARKPAIVWFRNDLRLHDHEPLHLANQEATSVLPVYCFDPREYGKSPSGFDKTGPHRARFILESVEDLRRRLRDIGSQLVVRVGRPEEVLPQLMKEVGAGSVYCQQEVTYEETQVEARVRSAVTSEGGEMKSFWSGTLYHMDDLPFKLPTMPSCYADFRERMNRVSVRQAIPVPESLKGMPLGQLDAGVLPSMQQLGFGPDALAGAPAKKALGSELKGGESEALRHLQAFVADVKSSASKMMQQVQQADGKPSSTAASGPKASTSNNVYSSNFSCKISPWLAMGCLSPRQMYHDMQRQLGQLMVAPAAASKEGAAGTSQPAPGSWLVFELLWRDFFRFITCKYSSMGLNSGSKTAGVQQQQAMPALVAA